MNMKLNKMIKRETAQPSTARAGRMVAMLLFVAFACASPMMGQASHRDGKVAPELMQKMQQHQSARLAGAQTFNVIVRYKNDPSNSQHEAIAGRLQMHMHHINGDMLTVNASQLNELANDSNVAYISPDRLVSKKWDNPAVTSGALQAATQYRFNGAGVGVAIIDSGINDNADLRAGNSNYTRIVYNETFVPGTTMAWDKYGHGTFVAGILAGNGANSRTGYPQVYTGIAPGVNIINLRVLDKNGNGTDSAVIAAIGRAIQLKGKYNIRIINLSVGRPVFESAKQDPLCQAVEAAYNAGILVVVAAGNDGHYTATNGYGTI